MTKTAIIKENVPNMTYRCPRNGTEPINASKNPIYMAPITAPGTEPKPPSNAIVTPII